MDHSCTVIVYSDIALTVRVYSIVYLENQTGCQCIEKTCQVLYNDAQLL